MTTAQKQALLKAIARATEKAYRRGFQQGHLAALDDEPPTEAEVAAWRFCGDDYEATVGPPGTAWAQRRTRRLYRLWIELDVDDPIALLIHEAGLTEEATGP